MIALFPSPTIDQVHDQALAVARVDFSDDPRQLRRMERILPVAAMRELCRPMPTYTEIGNQLNIPMAIAHRADQHWEKIPELERRAMMLAIVRKLTGKS